MIRQSIIRFVACFVVTLTVHFLHAQDSPKELNVRLAEVNSLMQQGLVRDALNLCDQLAADGIRYKNSHVFSNAINSKIGIYIRSNEPDSALLCYAQAAEDAEVWGHDSLRLHFALQVAMTKKKLGRGAEAFEDFRTLIPLLAGDPRLRSFALQEYGGLYYYIYHQPDSAIYYVDSAIHIVSVIQDSVRLSSALETRGSISHFTGSYLEAIEYILQALSYVSHKNVLKKFHLLSYISDIFKEISQLDRAQEYAYHALELAEEHSFIRSRAVAQNALGELFFEMSDYDKADSLFRHAEAYLSSNPSQRDYVQVKTNIARIALLNNLPEAALASLRSLESHAEEMPPNYIIAHYYLVYGQALYAVGDYVSARSKLYRSLDIALESGDPRSLLPALQEIKIVEKSLGNLSAALVASDKYLEIYDSTFQLRQSQLLFESESRYQRAEQDNAIAELNAESSIKDLNLAVRDTQLRYGLLALVMFAILAAYIFYLYRQVRKSKQEVDEKNAIVSKALSEKELLLKEIHHRVKNNLQVVSSLLSLQSRYIEDAQALEAIKEGRDRVKSMALIHQNLYQGEHLTGIEVGPYFEKVVRGLFNSYNIAPEQISMSLKIEEMILDVDTIIPIGLIVNELVSNALKHAFPNGRNGTISVGLREFNQKLVLTVADDGVGMERAWEEADATSFGFRLIQAFRDKLNADLTLKNNLGTHVEMAIRDYIKVG
jgi:two-component sensor histidine kinase